MFRLRRGFTAGAAVLFILAGCSAYLSAQTIENKTCMMCHSRTGSSIPVVDPAVIGSSIHGKLSCIACHKDANAMPHPKDLAVPSCALCHRNQSETYLGSRHGQAVRRDRTIAAVCSDCHGGTGHSVPGLKNPASPANRANVVDTCARCHADTERMEAIRLAVKDPVGTYLDSVHGRAFEEGKTGSAVCTDCHGTHGLYNSLNKKSRVSRGNIADTCGRCHAEIAKQYKESVHGRAALSGAVESAVCTDCHGGHAVRSSKESGISASGGSLTEACSKCHESEQIIRKFGLPADRLKTYMGSYHGLAALRGDLSVANCASCHGYHDVLPSSDPRSSINKANLAETCGRCHPGAGSVLASGNIHGSPESKHWSLEAVQWFYWIIIPLALAAMLLHNLLDWLRKAGSGIPTTVHSDEIRFTVNERLQHFLLVATFVLLALSGFALKFADAAWADYLAPSNEVVRRSLHRWAALFFTILSVYHCLYLAGTKRGRFVFRELLPRWSDVKDVFRVLAYNLHILKEPPKHEGVYRYPEKIEYWSLVWGSMLMIVTGSILVFNNFTLKHFPLWVSDLAMLAHYYEAILACLAIVIWHFYAVIFDPDVYPMNCAWLKGRVHCSGGGKSGNGRIFHKKVPYGRF
jgi:formate dehydrogenase gamma subunit